MHLPIRTGNRRFGRLGGLRAYKNAPNRFDLL
jgi:hypothetical protein